MRDGCGASPLRALVVEVDHADGIVDRPSSARVTPQEFSGANTRTCFGRGLAAEPRRPPRLRRLLGATQNRDPRARDPGPPSYLDRGVGARRVGDERESPVRSSLRADVRVGRPRAARSDHEPKSAEEHATQDERDSDERTPIEVARPRAVRAGRRDFEVAAPGYQLLQAHRRTGARRERGCGPSVVLFREEPVVGGRRTRSTASIARSRGFRSAA